MDEAFLTPEEAAVQGVAIQGVWEAPGAPPRYKASPWTGRVASPPGGGGERGQPRRAAHTRPR